MRTTALFGAKHIRLFEIYGVSAVRTDKRGWASADIFRTKGGQCFAILCGRPLWTDPNYFVLIWSFGYEDTIFPLSNHFLVRQKCSSEGSPNLANFISRF